ncbi:uncharacterized protein LOC9304222 [Arabidopsis lyrata subsp. lyrata]|uniref:uncharacterized protein LOC9304222 n=2 Tax=Arabidopsis lyrata subsp. lyrata TaxID=81972 RepID=UPI000A29E877|nr:uncharacterized protein LOC9304222 [Arabidopsis lyrata subsp. lyrata]|eukprot:XP_020872281.1 uncharacterized protein LOC9304222 [Arabidopsis lyrata subsp. lyrata]
MKSAGRDESETTLEGKNDFWSLVNKAACEVKEKLLSKSNHHQDKVNDLRREVTILMEILHAQDADAIPLVTRQNWAHLLCTEAGMLGRQHTDCPILRSAQNDAGNLLRELIGSKGSIMI